MRDPERIDDFCEQLKMYWKKVPDWRFGQLVVNLERFSKRDSFFYEEDEMLKLLSEYFSGVE